MSKIKDCFISRYKNGVICEADFSQLEVIYLAHITKDPQLVRDIKLGLDMHIVRAAELFGVPESAVTSTQRKTAKAFSFMLQYGAGAAHMAEETGHSKQVAETFIANYYARYPEVRAWQQRNIREVEKQSTPTTKKTPLGYPRRESTLVSETGRRYTFLSGDAPEWMKRDGKYTTFKPTEIKNYPIQGGATGDIVPMVIGKINRWLVKTGYIDKCKLIATVHDSIVLDIHPDLIYTITTGVKETMESAPQLYKQNFGVAFDLDLNVEVTYGPSWGEQTTVCE